HGRARSTRNAFRHGLSLPIQHDRARCEEVQDLARQIAGSNASAHLQGLALRVAEAQVDLCRIRNARLQFLSEALADRYRFHTRPVTRLKSKIIKQCLTPKLAELSLPAFIERFLTAANEGPGKLAMVVLNETKRLQAFDRYEPRALPRRKTAIRILDEARQQFAKRSQNDKPFQ